MWDNFLKSKLEIKRNLHKVQEVKESEIEESKITDTSYVYGKLNEECSEKTFLTIITLHHEWLIFKQMCIPYSNQVKPYA